MRFIKLTQGNGESVLYNVASIKLVYPTMGGWWSRQIVGSWVVAGGERFVLETPEEVLAIICAGNLLPSPERQD